MTILDRIEAMNRKTKNQVELRGHFIALIHAFEAEHQAVCVELGIDPYSSPRYEHEGFDADTWNRGSKAASAAHRLRGIMAEMKL